MKLLEEVLGTSLFEKLQELLSVSLKSTNKSFVKARKSEVVENTGEVDVDDDLDIEIDELAIDTKAASNSPSPSVRDNNSNHLGKVITWLLCLQRIDFASTQTPTDGTLIKNIRAQCGN